MPKGGPGHGKLKADLCAPASNGAKKSHIAFLLFLGTVMLKDHLAAAGHSGGQQYERTVGVDGQGFGFFVEIFAKRIVAANANGHLH